MAALDALDQEAPGTKPNTEKNKRDRRDNHDQISAET